MMLGFTICLGQVSDLVPAGFAPSASDLRPDAGDISGF